MVSDILVVMVVMAVMVFMAVLPARGVDTMVGLTGMDLVFQDMALCQTQLCFPRPFSGLVFQQNQIRKAQTEEKM